MTQWQPIETAPKDGTRVIVCWSTGEVTISSRIIGKFAHKSRDGMPLNGHEWFPSPAKAISRVFGWMPLPDPPA